MIHSDSPSEVYSKKHIPIWLISAFKCGFINSAGFLITGKYVSHVTGFGTQVGVALGHEEYFFGTELLLIPFSFIMGGVVTSYMLDREYEKYETPPYWIVQILITLLIGLIIFICEINYSAYEFLVISLLCFVCGLKNSLVTWSTYGKIRVSHLTGLSTDIGLHFIRMFKQQASPRFKEDRYVNLVRIFTFLSFSSGALISAMLQPRMGMHVLFIPLGISLCMTAVSIWDGRTRTRLFLINS